MILCTQRKDELTVKKLKSKWFFRMNKENHVLN